MDVIIKISRNMSADQLQGKIDDMRDTIKLLQQRQRELRKR